MRPVFEKVVPVAGSSWSFLDRKLNNGIPFEWHHHPEYELTMTLNSAGYRCIGDSIEPYADGDLALIGPNLPHSWKSETQPDPSKPHMAKVVWFSEAWISSLVSNFPELHRVRELVTKAGGGVMFSAEAARDVRPIMERIMEKPDDLRFVQLLSMLQRLSRDPGMRELSTVRSAQISIRDPRFERVLEHLHEHFAERLDIQSLADTACVSVSAFHRMFQRHTRVTALGYVARLRIGRACTMLIDGKLKIAAIASAVGYESLAQFNKEFRRQKGTTPSEFSARFQHIDATGEEPAT